jgi:hypothetical protein
MDKMTQVTLAGTENWDKNKINSLLNGAVGNHKIKSAIVFDDHPAALHALVILEDWKGTQQLRKDRAPLVVCTGGDMDALPACT